ncbi:MAG: aminotransferase class III-fold pyridoxal phosphate-dependent enzyme [Xanthomonadales bacterium]|nr:aminotransferase class III-fold pyridoxal phosphate-dependent enzyme [Xanthomonadales bacterium]
MTTGATSADERLLERRRRFLGPAYSLFYREPVHLVRGEGAWLFDAGGRRYLDCYNNVASVGHCHPRVVEALARQAAILNTHTRYLHGHVVDYAERLAATLPEPLSVCMFVCTGTEANDLALRIARAVTGHHGVIVTEDAYHGNSTAVFEMSTEEYPAAERPDYLEAVAAPCRYRGPCRDSDDPGIAYAGRVADAVAALAARGHRPALFVTDNAFSSNGVLTAPPGYLREAYRAVRAAGGLALADEVQSGLCRLGDHCWGFEDSDVVPDIVTMGKPLGDGHPLAAVVTTPSIAAAFAQRYGYFNTFGGNPVSAAVGLAVLDVIEDEDILAHVGETGRYLRAGLQSLADRHVAIGDVRGKGLFFGVEIVRDRATREADAEAAAGIREHLRRHGVLLGTTGPLNNVLKIRPPLVFGREHADVLLAALQDALQSGGRT